MEKLIDFEELAMGGKGGKGKANGAGKGVVNRGRGKNTRI
jgi:hypothetical protein